MPFQSHSSTETRKQGRYRLILLLLFLFIANPSQAWPRSDFGAIATQHPLATEAGARVLREGGNAVDAAVAAALTLAVVEPYNSGLGGGGMALVWVAKTGKVRALDFRETAPALARPDLYQSPELDPEASQVGPLAIAVPGEIAGLAFLHGALGKASWTSLFTEAIRHAEFGFPPDLELRRRVRDRADCLARDYHSAQVYKGFLADRPVENFAQPNLATSLKALRDAGAGAFYRGPLGRSLVENLRGKGALLDLEDLSAYRAVEREPLHADFPFGRLWGMPPPSSGGVSVLRGMNLLEAFFRREKNPGPEATALELLRVFAALFRDRNAGMGDPDFVKDMPIQDWLKKTDGNTSHLSVMDSEGNAVAMTLTLNLSFGSCVTAGETGILMNDEMDDFATIPGQPNAFGLVESARNAVAPGKRPLSSMSPTLLSKDRKALLAIGSPGGPRIITSVLQTLLRHFFLNESLEASIAADRLHYQVEPPIVYAESDRFFGLIVERLKLGTKLQNRWGNIQAVAYDPKAKRFTALSDPRGQGKALVVEASAPPKLSQPAAESRPTDE